MKQTNSRRMQARIAMGSAALSLWMVFFSCGVFVETIEYRVFLAPHSFPKHAEADQTTGIVATPYSGSATYALLVATICFTPTNLAFLALLGGLMGGCTRNILLEGISHENAEKIKPVRRRFLEESPWSAMMRSFIVYLCVIAGLYFAIDDPFKDSTPAQYIRLAGTISVLSILVGYDPSRLLPWLSLVEHEQSQRLTFQQKNGAVTINAEQNIPATEFHQSEDRDSAANHSSSGKSPSRAK